PLSRKKKWVRGYNQSEHLAKAFCKEDKYNLFSFEKRLLFKKRETKPQAEIKNRRKRLENIKGAFFIKDKEKIMGKTILLIDDVVTTGGTLKEASLVLKEAQAKKVCAFTLAH
ncbi:MAG: phosphoribosyltransferase family protein, partial [Clostridia bacterium]|nr:phosphoribosyltransferase family protein [Clostridia bacterium]